MTQVTVFYFEQVYGWNGNLHENGACMMEWFNAEREQGGFSSHEEALNWAQENGLSNRQGFRLEPPMEQENTSVNVRRNRRGH